MPVASASSRTNPAWLKTVHALKGQVLRGEIDKTQLASALAKAEQQFLGPSEIETGAIEARIAAYLKGGKTDFTQGAKPAAPEAASAQVHAGALGFETSEPKSALEQLFESNLPFAELVATPEVQTYLAGLRSKHFDGRPPAFQTRPGTKQIFAGKTYDVIEKLGWGGYGEVTRVRDETGAEWSLKHYHSNDTSIEGEQESLKVWSDKGVPTLYDSGCEIDHSTRTVKYRFVEGLTASDMFNDVRNPAFKAKFSAAYNGWMSEMQKLAPTARNKANDIVFEIKTGNFVYIDPG